MNRIKICCVILLVIFSTCLSGAQTNRVVYKLNYYDEELSKKTFKENKEKLEQYIMDILETSFKEMLVVEYELKYDKSKSIYTKFQALSNSVNELELSYENNIYFKNIETKDKIFTSDQTGSNVITEVPFEQYKWEITDETKLISGYKCFKAKFSFIQQGIGTIKPTKMIRFAWFTPEIPASFGPQGFDGLPGLVLETAENDKICLRAMKIEFDVDKNIKIEKPIASKTITLAEYETIIKESYEKMLNEDKQ